MPLTRNQSNAASQARVAAASASETGTSKESNEQGGTSTEAEPPRRDSPENCSICLGPFNNKSFTSSCAHSFCFVCLKQWSKVKAECPLCKQPFTSIFHNIRSNQHYDIYELPHQPSNAVDYNIFNYVGGPIPSFTAPTHHLFSLSQPGFDADLTLSNFSRFQFRHRRYDRYLNPLTVHGEHPYSFTGPSVNPASHISAATWPRGAEEFRREVYRRNLGPPAVIIGCENSTYRLTPAMVAASAHRIHRIMPWLTRELRVLLRSHQNVRLAISIIQPLLTQVTIDNICFYDRIAPLIGRRARQFVQEFVAFANSALTVQAYDRKAMYRRRDTVSALPSSSSSTSSENDVVEVTDISPDDFPSGANANPSAPGPSQTQPLNLSRSGWDSPTPGPSWDSAPVVQDSVIDRVSVSSESEDPVFRPDLRDSDSDKSKAGSDIIFVKYDKPWNERSPINLTSDSDGGEGNELSRKKKKSKHKKRKKELVDNGDGSGVKKDKGKKSSSKSKQRDKPKSTSKAAVSDEEKESNEISKRRHSQSSTEHHKAKKHKRSKSKKKLSDREIVDRLFAQAMSQNKDENSSESDDQELNVSAKPKERGSSKEKSKKKKKSRKHSKDSHNQSSRHTYKKHHSGHKKSSNRLADGLSEQHSRHPHTHSPIRQGQVGGPSRSDSMGNDNISQHEASGSTMSHSVVPGFQPPYLGMTDTVQHIPVNLWVSAWPTLSVSHTYPPPPPPIAMGQGIPQSSNTSSSTMTSNPNGTAEPSNKAQLERLSISSDSSSDSNSESDDAQDLQIPSLQNVHSRTKQWLETNFPDLGRPQTSSSSIPPNSVNNMSSTSVNINASNAVIESSGLCPQNLPENGMESTVVKESEVDVVEVVSIASGDDDVVVCSSDDSNSDVGDLWVIDVDDSNKKPNTNKSSSSNVKDDLLRLTRASTLPFNGSANNPPESKAECSSGPSNIILPPVNKSFQPFKLQKKPAMAICGKDPFFPPMTHSSDEDGEVDDILQATSKPAFANEAMSQSAILSSVSKSNELSSIDNLEDIASTTALVGSLTTVLDTMAAMHSSPQSTEISKHVNACQANGIITTTSFTTPTSSVFSVLPPLASSSHSSKPNISSGIGYLPYANLPPPSVSSILPYGPQSTIPPPPVSLSLPFPPPFPQIPLGPTTAQSNNPILPSLYPPQNQVTSDISLQFLAEEHQQGDDYPRVQLQENDVNVTNERLVQSDNNQHFSARVTDSSKREPELLGSFDNVLNQNDSQSNGIVPSSIVSSERQCDNNFVPEAIDKEFSCGDRSVPHYSPNCVQNASIDMLEGHEQKELATIESDFSKHCSGPQNETLESTAISNFSPSDTISTNDRFDCHTENSCEKLPSDLSASVNGKCDNKMFDALDKSSDESVLPTDSFSDQEANDKLFDALDKSSDDSVLPTDSFSHQDSMDKPFDALDNTITNNNVPLSNSLHSSVSNLVSVEVSMTTTVPPVTETSLQSSAVPSMNHYPKLCNISHHPYQSETIQPEASSVFKPYSDDTDQPLHQFTDALVSSDSDSDV